jgi:hypothetical protein
MILNYSPTGCQGTRANQRASPKFKIQAQNSKFKIFLPQGFSRKTPRKTKSVTATGGNKATVANSHDMQLCGSNPSRKNKIDRR